MKVFLIGNNLERACLTGFALPRGQATAGNGVLVFLLHGCISLLEPPPQVPCRHPSAPPFFPEPHPQLLLLSQAPTGNSGVGPPLWTPRNLTVPEPPLRGSVHHQGREVSLPFHMFQNSRAKSHHCGARAGIVFTSIEVPGLHMALHCPCLGA